MSEQYIYVDRYTALGIPYPDPATVCKGECEGIGFVPIQGGPSRSGLRVEGNLEEPWRSLWLEVEKKKPSDDGWHFVTCPECKGTGRRA